MSLENLGNIGEFVGALAVVLSGRDFGPMLSAERRVSVEGKVLRDGAEPLVATEVLMLEAKEGVKTRAINMLLPVAAIIVTVLIWARFSARIVGRVSFCPQCGGKTTRIHRRKRHRLLGKILGMPVTRRKCSDCGWRGLTALT